MYGVTIRSFDQLLVTQHILNSTVEYSYGSAMNMIPCYCTVNLNLYGIIPPYDTVPYYCSTSTVSLLYHVSSVTRSKMSYSILYQKYPGVLLTSGAPGPLGEGGPSALTSPLTYMFISIQYVIIRAQDDTHLLLHSFRPILESMS